jgi:hypothetical protein
MYFDTSRAPLVRPHRPSDRASLREICYQASGKERTVARSYINEKFLGQLTCLKIDFQRMLSHNLQATSQKRDDL